MAKPWDITSPPTDAGKIVHYPGGFVSAAQGSWASLIKYQARSRASSSVGSDRSHLLSSVPTFRPNRVGHFQRRRCCGTAYSLPSLLTPYLVVERLTIKSLILARPRASNFTYFHTLVQSKMLLIGIVGLLGVAVSAYPQTEVIHTDAVARSGRRFISKFLEYASHKLGFVISLTTCPYKSAAMSSRKSRGPTRLYPW